MEIDLIEGHNLYNRGNAGISPRISQEFYSKNQSHWQGYLQQTQKKDVTKRQFLSFVQVQSPDYKQDKTSDCEIDE